MKKFGKVIAIMISTALLSTILTPFIAPIAECGLLAIGFEAY